MRIQQGGRGHLTVGGWRATETRNQHTAHKPPIRLEGGRGSHPDDCFAAREATPQLLKTTNRPLPPRVIFKTAGGSDRTPPPQGGSLTLKRSLGTPPLPKGGMSPYPVARSAPWWRRRGRGPSPSRSSRRGRTSRGCPGPPGCGPRSPEVRRRGGAGIARRWGMGGLRF